MRFLRRVAAGAKAGLLAGAGVAVLFLLEDAVQLRPLSTPAALASGLLDGGAANGAGELITRLASGGALAARIIVYTLLHLLAFAGVGVVAAFALEARFFVKALLTGAVYGSVVCTGVLYGAGWIIESPFALDALGVPSVLLANAMAGTILGLTLHLDQLDPEVDASL
jgi:hypothetical protein